MKNNPYYNKSAQLEVINKIPQINPLGPLPPEPEELVRTGKKKRTTPKSFFQAHAERRTLADLDDDPERKAKRLKRLMWGLG